MKQGFETETEHGPCESKEEQAMSSPQCSFRNRHEHHRKSYFCFPCLFLNVNQETLFGRTVTPAERLRQHQRALTKAQRELDRERNKLEQSEKKLVQDIKKSAKAGQMVFTLP